MDATSHVTIQGGLMAARMFDTYMPGGEEPLISFINSISDGRIICLAILVSCLSSHVSYVYTNGSLFIHFRFSLLQLKGI